MVFYFSNYLDNETRKCVITIEDGNFEQYCAATYNRILRIKITSPTVSVSYFLFWIYFYDDFFLEKKNWKEALISINLHLLWLKWEKKPNRRIEVNEDLRNASRGENIVNFLVYCTTAISFLCVNRKFRLKTQSDFKVMLIKQTLEVICEVLVISGIFTSRDES